MLTASQFDDLLVPITDLYERYNQSIINDIARRLARLDMTATAAWQMQRLTESGKIYENALDELADLTGESTTVLKQIFSQAGVKATRFDDRIYKAAGLNPLPLNLSPAMLHVLQAGLQKTSGVMSNLTLTSAIDAQHKFLDAADLAYMQVSNGAMSYDQAIQAAIKDLAGQGLSVINYASGRVDQLEVAMRRAVLTGVSQTTGVIQLNRAQELGCDLVQTSAHIGARPEHEEWQGKVFSLSGKDPRYPDFVSSTGYGEVDGLHGINCRHDFYPFFEGISENAYSEETLNEYAEKTVTYNGQEMPIYEATQKQRAIEREIRKVKREAGARAAAELDNSQQIARVKDLQARMRDFVDQTGLSRQSSREGGRVARSEASNKTVGFSFLSGDTNLSSTAQARQLGESADGWGKYEEIFKANYLKPFRLEDDVERTLGFWGGPEPSFNAHLMGRRENVIEMSKAWAKEHNQQGMAILFPNPDGEGGKLIWNFGKVLSDSEMDLFFANLDRVNKELGEQFNDYFGVTVKGSRNIEYWFSGGSKGDDAYFIINRAIEKTNLSAVFNREEKYDFLLLMKGVDY